MFIFYIVSRIPYSCKNSRNQVGCFMAQKSIDRKIAVIFATDIVGYSKHMESNENATIINLRSCEEIFVRLLEKHRGRLFNTGGDSFLAEFQSAVSAVECALEFQEAIKKRNLSPSTIVKLEFRIGINSGDVVKEKTNLLGDGVNIAARLESISQANGITVSKSIFDFIRGKINVEFNDLGIQRIKKNEFHAFDIILDDSQKRKIKRSQLNKVKLLLGSLVVFIVCVSGYFIFNELSKPSQQLAEKNLNLKSSLPLILVRPVKSNNVKAENKDIVIGITEFMISILSKYNGLKILSSNTSFHIAKKSFNDQQLKDEYNIDYTIEGTLQIMGKSSRLLMSLNDLNKEKVIWSDIFDFELSNIFEVQDKIGDKILSTLQIDAITGSQGISWAEEIKDLETLTIALNLRSEWRKFTRDGYQKSYQLLNELEEKIGDTGSFYNWSAWQVFQKINLGFSTDLDNDKEELKNSIQKALEVRGNAEDFSLNALSELLYLSNSCEIARLNAEKALSIGGGVDVYTILGSVYSGCGDLITAVKYTKQALELTPNDNGWFITNNLVSFLYQLGRYEEIRSLIGEKIYADDMLITIIAVFAVIEHKSGNYSSADRLLKIATSQGLDKQRIRAWLNNGKAGEDLISDLNSIAILD